MTTFKNKYSQSVYEILHPLIGDLMAQSILKIHSVKLKKDMDTLSALDMPMLADSIQKGIIIFLGSDAARSVASRISSIK